MCLVRRQFLERVALFTSGIAAAVGCFRSTPTIQHGRRPTPAAELHLMEAELPPLADGQGRLFVACVDSRCRVLHRKESATYSAQSVGATAFGSGATTRVLCTETPCYADLSPGNYELQVFSEENRHCYEDTAVSGKTYACSATAVVNIAPGWYTGLVVAPDLYRETDHQRESWVGSYTTWSLDPAQSNDDNSQDHSP